MADAVASPLLRALSDRLNSVAGASGNRILRNMRLTLAEIETLVLDAEARSVENEALRCWLAELKDAAYDADDILDEFFLHRASDKMVFKVRNLFSFSENPLLFCFRLEDKMKNVEARLDELAKRRFNLQIAAMASHSSPKTLEEDLSRRVSRHTSSFIEESGVFGRGSDKETLIHMLVSDNRQNLCVIPIVGMGGIGKTTLAQLVYNDECVKLHFSLRAWVSVSDDFDVKMIAKAILDYFDSPNLVNNLSDHSNTDILDNKVRLLLRQHRFLIVLDGVWNDDHEKWEILKRCFNVGAGGSKVIVTTRSENVAALMGTVPHYRLKPLSDEECWSLFKHRALGSSQEEANPNLADIQKKIVNSCKGLPLAVSTLAALMRSKEWVFAADDDFLNLPGFESKILPALRLSYDDLPSHLKQCFAYFAMFPKGYRINKRKLILLWIAEGFIQPTKGSKMLEDIGNEYFMELLWRSFFLEVKRNDCGDILEFRMHDFVHDLARSVARIGCSIVEAGVLPTLSEQVRHFSLIHSSGPSTIPEALHEVKNLRTLLLSSSKLEEIPSSFLRLSCLRVLDLSQTGIRRLPVSLGSLKHLRFLDLSHTYVETLPESISKLKSLQILNLNECYHLKQLPGNICELTNLRHLALNSCCVLSHMPSGIAKLRLLQTLPVFILGKSDGCANLSELGWLDLRGNLEIKNLEYVKDLHDALNANLFSKVHIHSLGLSWGHDVGTNAGSPVKVLENLKPPLNLRVLEISEYRDSIFPSWIRSPVLSNLLKVSLTYCSCRELPPLGWLPLLKDLYVKGMSAVEIIGDEFYGNNVDIGFPSLRQLELYDMPNLSEWKSFDVGQKFSSIEIEEGSSYRLVDAFPCLGTLILKGCSKLTSLPFLRDLENLVLWSCNEMLLSSLANLMSLSSVVINGFKFQSPVIVPWDLGRLNCIRILTIYDCDNLTFLLEEGMKGFKSLIHLSILYCHKLSSLPRGLRYLTSLQRLDIVECQNLANVPDIMQDLFSLKELIIDSCPKLSSLPDSLCRHMSLQVLVIKRCPELAAQLNKNKGKDWHKIAHIPYVQIETGGPGGTH